MLANGVENVEIGLPLDCTPKLITLIITTKDMSKPLDLLLIGKELAMYLHVRTDNEQPVFPFHGIPLSLKKGSKTQSIC